VNRILSRTYPSARALIVLVLLAGAGFAVDRAGEARGMGFGAGYYSNLSEISGGEKVGSLSVYNVTSDWFSCGGYVCNSVPQYASVSWTVSDGYSTFDKVVSRHEPNGQYCRSGASTNAYVYAGPSNPYGTQYVYYPTLNCPVSYSDLWEWSSGMCDTAADCVWFISHGPHISATLTPPSSSAYNFIYRW
jgi:hypothetical protein